MFFGLYPSDATYSSDEVSLALFRLVKNTAVAVLAGVFAAVFLFPTAESRLTCARDDGQQFHCYEAKAVLGFLEVRKHALPGLAKEEIRSRLRSRGADGPGIGEAEISEFLSGRGPARVHVAERVPLSLLWWILCGILALGGLYAILWFPFELYYWLSHRERKATSP